MTREQQIHHRIEGLALTIARWAGRRQPSDADWCDALRSIERLLIESRQTAIPQPDRT